MRKPETGGLLNTWRLICYLSALGTGSRSSPYSDPERQILKERFPQLLLRAGQGTQDHFRMPTIQPGLRQWVHNLEVTRAQGIRALVKWETIYS